LHDTFCWQPFAGLVDAVVYAGHLGFMKASGDTSSVDFIFCNWQNYLHDLRTLVSNILSADNRVDPVCAKLIPQNLNH